MRHYILDTNAIIKWKGKIQNQDAANIKILLPLVVLQEFRAFAARNKNIILYENFEKEITDGSIEILEKPDVSIAELAETFPKIDATDFLIASTAKSYSKKVEDKDNQIYFVTDDIKLAGFLARELSIKTLKVSDFNTSLSDFSNELQPANTFSSQSSDRIVQLEVEISNLKQIVLAINSKIGDLILTNSPEFVDNERLKELRRIQSAKFDLTRLIKLCEEANKNYVSGSYLSTAMLVRAILDHIPPIFELRSFSEVANNYKGSKSFKQCASHLENSSRKIADAYLHEQIRSKETLPNKTQVNFSSDLDMILAEIIRILSFEL